jgi:hypothetical protein
VRDDKRSSEGTVRDASEGAKPRQADRSRLENLALVAEIAGGVAVVISVLYLAVQISDNNKLLRSQAHYNALELTQRPFELMVESGDLANIVFECDRDPDSVSETYWKRCKNYYLMQVNGWEYVYYQHLDEALPPELWHGVDAYFTDQVDAKAGYDRFWRETSLAFGEPFQSYVAERVGRDPGPAEP